MDPDSQIDSYIGLWSMRPSPLSKEGKEWEDGARAGFSLATSGEQSGEIYKPGHTVHWYDGAEKGYEWGIKHAPISGLLNAVTDYRKARSKLCELRHQIFKIGDPVKVDAIMFKGYGRVAFGSDDLGVDQLPVMLENGNTWYYPVESCTPAEEHDSHVLAKIPK